MLAKLLPILLALTGLGAGVGGGIMLRPVPEPPAEGQEATPSEQEATPAREYVKLNNQFVVPIVEGGRVAALVIMSLSVEVPPGGTEQIFAREPKLRDALLQVMFDHANAGGFRGTFTDGSNMVLLRNALREMAIKTMGPLISDVLIVEIVRQDS